MRIVCPSCSATYDVPDSLIPAGRVVRCARCGDDWAPVAAVVETVPDEPEPLPEPSRVSSSEPEPLSSRSAMERLAAHAPATGPSQLRLRLAWAGSIAVLVLLVGAAYSWRSDIVAAWPPSARAYTAFGLNTEAGHHE